MSGGAMTRNVVVALLIGTAALSAASQNRIVTMKVPQDQPIRVETQRMTPAAVVFEGVDSILGVMGAVAASSAGDTSNQSKAVTVDGWTLTRQGNTVFLMALESAKNTTILVGLSDKSIRIVDLMIGNQRTNMFKVIDPAIEKEKEAKAKQAMDVANDVYTPPCVNTRYSKLNGKEAENISPLHVCDDNKFTYMQFQENTPLPNVYRGYPGEEREALVNTTIKGKNWVIVHGVAAQWNLRLGQSVIGIAKD